MQSNHFTTHQLCAKPPVLFSFLSPFPLHLLLHKWASKSWPINEVAEGGSLNRRPGDLTTSTSSSASGSSSSKAKTTEQNAGLPDAGAKEQCKVNCKWSELWPACNWNGLGEWEKKKELFCEEEAGRAAGSRSSLLPQNTVRWRSSGEGCLDSTATFRCKLSVTSNPAAFLTNTVTVRQN